MFRVHESKQRKTLIILMLSLALLSFVFVIPAVSAGLIPDPEGYYEITLASHTYDVGSDISTWTYDVTVHESAPHGLSHWILEWCGGPGSLVPDGASYQYIDPTTGITGIKFDYGHESGTQQYSFQLYGDYSVGTVQVAVKTGGKVTQVYYGETEGPVFTYTFTAQISGSGYGSTYMIANATTDYPDLSKVTVTFRWWGPYEAGEVPELCTTPTDPIYRGPIVDDTPPFNDQIGPLVEAQLGYWYVEAEFNIDNADPECEETLHAIINVTEVPWFTNLGFALLAAVGAIVFLRRRGTLKLPV